MTALAAVGSGAAAMRHEPGNGTASKHTDAA